MTALLALPTPRGTPSRRADYAARRALKRVSERKRIAVKVLHRSSAALTRDPLYRPKATRRGLLGRTGLMVLGSILAHAMTLSGFALAGGMWSRDGADLDTSRERLQVALVETVTPPPIDHATRRRPAGPSPAAPEQKSVTPKPPPEPTPPKKAALPPRRIVGLSLESTVTGGSGVAFAVGNTRLGESSRVAEDPSLASSPLPRNKKASHIPTASVSFVPPVKILTLEPVYPATLKVEGIEADVVLRVTVGADGRVRQVRVVKGAQDSAFDGAALETAKQERYRPATVDGAPVEHAIKFTVRFRLTDY